MKKLLFSLLILCMAAGPLFADTLYLNSKITLRVKIIHIDSKTIEFVLLKTGRKLKNKGLKLQARGQAGKDQLRQVVKRIHVDKIVLEDGMVVYINKRYFGMVHAPAARPVDSRDNGFETSFSSDTFN